MRRQDKEAYLDRLNVHLKQLKREGVIATWSAAETGAGAEAQRATATHLQTARVILLLVSPDYLASDEWLRDVQRCRASGLRRHERNEARVVPIVLQRCDFGNTPLARLQILPRIMMGKEAPKPVYGFSDREVAYAEITQDLRREVEKLRAGGF